jgi:hypothetical protein
VKTVIENMDYKDEEKKIEHTGLHHESPEFTSGELVTLDNGATDVVINLPSEEQRRILRKVDMRLVPLLAFLYLVAFVDRSNSMYGFLP